MPHPKNIQVTDEKYLDWIRRQPSIVSGKFDVWDDELGEGRNDPSHLWGCGKRGKRNDHLATPKTRREHSAYHTLGHDTFEDKYNIDLMAEVINLLSRYIEERTQ